MSVYITVMFWLYLITVLACMLTLGISKYPRVIERSIGMDIVILVEMIAMLCWTTYIKYNLIS